ncbi:MAG: TlpA family protein disulfide reductase [Planctomycetaceae bacterium]|jgi:peroxiredoxin|nr:TlpA family protein disulfide reductase [Planctomycetaceae bacterium]
MRILILIFCAVCLTVSMLHRFAIAQHTETELYAIPNNKSPKELLEYARKIIQDNRIPPNLPRAELLKLTIRQAKFIVEISDTALNQKPSESLRSQIYQFKFQGLMVWTKAENTPELVQQLESFLDELDELLPKSREAKMARLLNMTRQIDLFIGKNPNEKEFERIKNLFFSLLRREPIDFPPDLAMNFIEFAELAEIRLQKKGLIEASSKELIALLQSESSPVYREMIKQIDSVMQRLGHEFTLQGVLLDGKSFDIKTFRGKVVLVDFFASWCAPCIEELPHLKEIYVQYHDRGFEIVGVGGDKSAALKKLIGEQKIPWSVVSEELTVAKRLPSIERQYGIKAYPTMFLIDREGRLINSNARGQRLEAALKRQFQETAALEDKD